MTQISGKGGRRPKTDPSVNRYVVRFNAEENARFLAMFDRSGLESKGAFIRNFIFQKPFKVYTIDENTRVFIDNVGPLQTGETDYRAGKGKQRDCRTRTEIR